MENTRHPPTPRRPPILSVVIRGVEPTITDEETEQELLTEGHIITKCLRIKTTSGTKSYMIRVLTNNQDTINELLYLFTEDDIRLSFLTHRLLYL